ncbi:MAG: tRNA-modifying protein YgfZ [Ignavibacteria bacterium]|nr:tRNA-modifying protein YgfZ [Ignavibacteria bacterium]
MSDTYFIRQAGILISRGKDLNDFLNRMSTNDYRKPVVNEYKKTVLTSDKGRIIDLVTLININDKSLLRTSAFNKEKVITHLEKYIISDDVFFDISDKKYFELQIFTENPDRIIKLVSGKNISGNEVISLNENDFIFRDDFRKSKAIIICIEENCGYYEEKLKEIKKLSAEEYESFRIDNGIPDSIDELNEEINPVECGLKNFISFNKGCYIGQEVIARLDSQGKIPKQMIKIESEVSLNNGDKIFSEEKEAGFILSAVKDREKFKALGFIRTTELDFGKEYYTMNENIKNKINIFKIN